jgi:hypothetical protein
MWPEYTPQRSLCETSTLPHGVTVQTHNRVPLVGHFPIKRVISVLRRAPGLQSIILLAFRTGIS